ncbi:unnamed protein product [Cylindrotheca closterium]|uniref:Uncharacterized protein n=1 Tax=Cylindrotheca closterium TaxID=2856 RepID=A0AAD2PVR1_9STRA|nr:unnamed protein product [Cylindrotheca closterium]
MVEPITGHRKTATLDSNPLTSSYRETKARYRRNSALYQADAVEGEGTGVEAELERLQEQLSLIEALEERNKAQLDSFVDEDDQWNSLEEYEKELLNCKDKLVERMDILAEQMVMLWMGQKSQDG